jgi:hypothetical protein
MRKFSFVASVTMLFAFVSAALAPAASAATKADNAKPDYGHIKVCKEQRNYNGDEYFKFKIYGDHYYKEFRVKGGECSDRYKVDKGKYTIYEYDKKRWTLYDISGDYNNRNVRERYADVRVRSGDNDKVTFYNRYHKDK